jgi:hypothetical protein
MLLLALLVALPTWAQEAAEDDPADELARIGLEKSPDLRKAKRRHAKKEGWALTGVAAGAVGYDSNIFQGPESTQDSAVFDLDAKFEGLFYFTGRDRLKAGVESTNRPYTASSKVDDLTQKGMIAYYHRFREVGTYSLGGEVKHSNDSATNSIGEEFTRDFEYVSYRGRTAFRWKPAADHVLRFRYGFKRKDYVETEGLNSLDWWRHGLKVQYAYRDSDPLRLWAGYEFEQQLYDDEDAANRDGSEPEINPAEEHFFHTARASAKWQVSPILSLSVEFRFRNKDDRFDDYESYYDHRGEFEVALVPIESLRLEARTRISHRDYHRRPEDTTVDPETGTLEYNRYRVDLTARYEITEHLAVWAVYGFDKRDSNRIGGTSFRSYEQHLTSLGVTAAY